MTAAADAPMVNRRALGYWIDLIFSRLLPAIFFSVFLVFYLLRVLSSLNALRQPADYLFTLGQVLALAYFTMLVVLYSTRLPKKAGDRRPGVIFIAFTGTFSIIAAGFLPGGTYRPELGVLGVVLTTFGLAYAVWGLAYLRRSFSIMPEARSLVTGGPYRLSRHPVYLGEVISGIGVYVAVAGWPSVLAIAYFLICQFLRIGFEERILSEAFPSQYPAYAAQVPRYVPNPLRLLN